MYHYVKIGSFCFGVELGKFGGELPQPPSRPVVLVYTFDAFDGIDLQREIEGKDERVKQIAELSKNADCAVFCGAVLDVFGIKKEGAVVCNKGALADITERTNAVKVFASESGSVGLLLDDDCVSERHWEKITSAADVVLCLSFGGGELIREEVRLFSAAYKTPYLFVSPDGIEWIG